MVQAWKTERGAGLGGGFAHEIIYGQQSVHTVRLRNELSECGLGLNKVALKKG
jgi:hypothetical protein